jgi:hypothetical protein
MNISVYRPNGTYEHLEVAKEQLPQRLKDLIKQNEVIQD